MAVKRDKILMEAEKLVGLITETDLLKELLEA